MYCFFTRFVLGFESMLIKIGKMWKHRKRGVVFPPDHLSPSQLTKSTDQWFYNYCVLDEKIGKKQPPNMKMIFGGIVGRALQDMIVHKLTINEIMKGKPNAGQLAKLQTQNRNLTKQVKKQDSLIKERDEEITDLRKKVRRIRKKRKKVAKNQSYIHAKALKDIEQKKK